MRSARAKTRAQRGSTSAVWTVEPAGAGLLIRIAGSLGRAEMARLDLDLALRASPGARVVLDLGAVSHVDYRELSLLSRRAERLADRGGALALCRSSRYVRAILEVGSTPGALEVHERAEDAWAALAARAS